MALKKVFDKEAGQFLRRRKMSFSEGKNRLAILNVWYPDCIQKALTVCSVRNCIAFKRGCKPFRPDRHKGGGNSTGVGTFLAPLVSCPGAGYL